jgi:hypothetical protein
LLPSIASVGSQHVREFQLVPPMTGLAFVDVHAPVPVDRPGSASGDGDDVMPPTPLETEAAAAAPPAATDTDDGRLPGTPMVDG